MQRPLVSTPNEIAQEKFSVRVKTALVTRGMTVTDLAKKIDRSRHTTSQAIHLGCHQPTIKKICKALHLSI